MMILLTGAAGGVGTLLRPELLAAGHSLRLVDLVAIPDPAPGEEAMQASVTDLAGMEQACHGAEAIVHLGGHSSERRWDEILDANIHGTYTVLEAARRQGVRHVLFASSAHAVGFVPAEETLVNSMPGPRPDTLYGVSKVTGEALCSLYADRYRMRIVCARIGTVQPEPASIRSLSTWLSPGDLRRLVEATITGDTPGSSVVWGVSRNTRRWVSLEAGQAIGYRPRDDAEEYAARFPDAGPPGQPASDVLLGGPWCGPEYDVTRWPG